MSIADRISALTPAQRELLDMLRRKSGAERPAAPAGPPPIATRPPGHAWPLALDQERLWFLYQLDPSDPSYNLPSATRLRGRLNAAVLSRAVDEIVCRHEAWRTSCPEVDGRPMQVIAPPAPVPFPQVDLAGLPAAAREREAVRLRNEVSRLPFDLARGPLLRLLLLRLAPDLHEMELNVHHIVTDWYSSVLFWNEVQRLYPALLAGRPADLPALPVQYADFAIWQREQLSGPALQPHLDYWIEHLEGAPPALELPTDRPRPAHATTRGRSIPLPLGRTRTDRLKALCQRERVTPFMLMLALFQTLLSRWSGQDRVLVSAPNANRNREELQHLLGFFLTQLVFSTDLGGDPPFRELLGRVRQVALGAFAHQDLPFGKLVEALRPERDTSRPPVAQVELLVLDGGGNETLIGDLAAVSVDVDSGTAAFELILALWDSPAGYTGHLEHNADLWDPATGGRLAEGFVALLDAVLERVDAPLSALPVQGEGAAHQALIEWNDTGAFASPSGALLHSRFFAQAERTPGAVAVIDGPESLTYRELASRAGALAERLRRMGIGPEARVAVCLPRSAGLVTALLGVLAAGGAYVPIDPEYPRDHQRFMLEDCGAAVVIDSPSQEPSPPAPLPQAGEGRKALEIKPFAVHPSPACGRGAGGEGLGGATLAYLIYTSGSTGRPKAVGITHHNAAALVEWALATFPDDLSGGVLASTSICFDLSVFEIFGPLSCGGTVILAENALALPELPAAGRVELVNTVPSALAELLRLGPLPPSVRTISLCGEPFSRHLADEIEARGIRRAVNYYGPTEDTVYSTWTQVPRGETLEPAIGRSITGSRAYVLDPALRPVPLGARGDLYLAGDGLARGYLGRPDLTAERFVPDPVTECFSETGGRMYRTGDLARWRASGQLEFLGRADRQVKVRGFRVEPAEIEAVLAEIPGVAGVAVAVRGGRLAAWLVPGEGIAGDALLEAVRDAVLDRLPRHMVPSFWAHLPALPYTPNGKLDHRALPLPGGSGAAGGDGYEPPRHPDEVLLAGIWAEVLGLPQVGVHDNFFRLGGDSILSIRVVARARQAGLELSPRQVFERQTVAELAAAVERIGQPIAPAAAGTPPAFSLAGLAPEALDRWLEDDPAIEDLYPLSPLQAGFLFHGLYAPATEIYFEQITGTLRGALDGAAFRRAWQRLLDRHAILRTAFAWEGLDEPLQVVRRGVEMPWVEEDWRQAIGEGEDPDARLTAFAAADRQNAFGLRRAPLLRMALLRTGEREHRFVWSFHHALLDGWSLPRLLAEVFALYQENPLPPPALPYRDFVAWLARRDHAADERYWRQSLAGISGPTPLPWDADAPPARRAGESTQHEAALSAPATAALEAFGRERGLTLNTAVQGAWALLLSRWSGEREVVFGAVSAGRPAELPGVESAIGLFINTLPVRVEIDPERPLAAWLGALQGAQIEARQHEQAPLAEVQRWSGASGREPLFHSLVVFESYPLDTAMNGSERRDGLELADVRTVERTSYPLSLAVLPDRGLRLRLTHDRRLEPATGQRLIGWLTRLLDRFAAGPDLPLEAFELLSQAERHQLLAEWNDTAAPPLPEERLDRLFRRQAERTPEAPAVRFRDEVLTFREMAERVDHLAARLRAQGVGPDVPVVLLLDRGLDLPVAAYAVLAAGGAFVPLDPKAPEKRLAGQIASCGAGLVIDREWMQEPSPPAPLPQAVEGKKAAESTGSPENLAYIIFTSGSTGAPKGTLIRHRAVANLVLALRREVYGETEGLRVALNASMAFDGAIKQLVQIASGHCLDLLPEEVRLDPGRLPGYLNEHAVDALDVTPSQLRLLLSEGTLAGRSRVPGRVLVGGEALDRATWDALAADGRTAFFNVYGPTECTVDTTAARIAPGAAPHAGRPLANMAVYLLAPDGRPVPPGAVGQVCVGGAGLARGYLGRPDLTAAVFVPDPFSGVPGARLYATGDLGRFLPDGRLKLRGRADRQVKIRGYRVEPGEIEAVLRRHPQVHEAAVVAQGGPEPRLAAWIIPRDKEMDRAALRSWLLGQLPEPMVPAEISLLEELPRTLSGKVDRRALAARAPEAAGAGRPFVAPANDLEEKLAGLWRDLLKVPRVGRGDNFFELGGHSLLATRLMVRVRDHFGVDLPLPAIFEATDLAALAREILSLRLRAESPDDLAHLMAELDGLSDDEAESLLADSGPAGPDRSIR